MDHPSKTSRREFLAGESARQALDAALPQPQQGQSDSVARRVGTSDTPPAAGGNVVLELERTAMACQFQVLLNAGQHLRAEAAALEALDLVDQLESQLSWFRADSELSRINQRAFTAAVAVEPPLFTLLELARRIWTETDGAFDITASPLWQLWGFHRRQGQLPDLAAIAARLRHVGMEKLTLDAAARTVRFSIPELNLNLAAIGKGCAVDRAAELLRERGVANFVVHGGHSSILARGDRGDGGSAGRGWRVGLRHPLRPDQHLGDIWLRGRALGTSGSANQFFHVQGRRFGHVIDPRRGWPCEGVLSATVLADSAAEADALSTALFVLGRPGATAYCQQHPRVGAILVLPLAGTTEIEVAVCGAVDDAWLPHPRFCRPPPRD